MNQSQNDSKVIDVLGAYRTISGKSIECISVLCIVPFAEGLVDDIVSCDESVSVNNTFSIAINIFLLDVAGSFSRSTPR